MPPRSRSRTCRAISTAASQLSWNTVSCRSCEPTNLPVLTSMTVSASVWSTYRYPPFLSHTLCCSALSSLLSMRYASNSGMPPPYTSTRPHSSGEMRRSTPRTCSALPSSSSTKRSTSAVNRSRTVRASRFSSSCTQAGALRTRARCSISFHSAVRYAMSATKSAALKPSAAVRTISPMPSGLTHSASSRSRCRSSSLLMRRDTPT